MVFLNVKWKKSNKLVTLELEKDELQLMRELLRKLRAQTNTDGFEEEKRSIESIHAGQNENVIFGKEECYRKLLEKIQRFL
ncbi:MAG: hypothetical protein Ta2G_12610 [Termitinemataceae bacterium]|nr:MAG: hypothetical protein Ta2G_12610 [Termitinemataceae bacterium]